MIAALTNTNDAIMFKLFFSTATIGVGLAVAALIAWSHAVAPLQSNHDLIIDQPNRHDGDLQGSASS